MADEPIIPEYITVHLGPPGSNAQNVTVTFPEYIKNVASSEIYPTWPESALIANIYAQISFALNRVFLEHYRAQGYNFDITNSTAYDQSFVPGRNIFDNIDRLVDEIFTNYLRRYGTLEPLAAKFCNGTTVTCEGLSQWGSVDLANQGYTPYEIITHYYGDDVQIVYNAPVGIRGESYPGSPLRLGSTGPDVVRIQSELNAISNHYPAIPKIYPVDGVFDEETEAAVRKFQQIFGLAVDGIVGRNTWYKLVFLYVGIKRLSELDSEGVYLQESSFQFPYGSNSGTASVAAIAQAEDNTVSYGDVGDAVRVLQYFLSTLAVFYPTIPSVPISGVFDLRTENAVKQAQVQFGLEPTGVVDEETWNTLYQAYLGAAEFADRNGEILPLPQTTNYGGQPLSQGSTGESVRVLQNALNVLASAHVLIGLEPLEETGLFGPKTKRNIITYQNHFGLPATGVVEYNTWNHIQDSYFDALSAIMPNLRQYPGYELQNGMTDTALQNALQTVGIPVQNLQRMMRNIGNYSDEIPLIAVDGVYGPETAAAVAAFQEAVHLPVTGVVDNATWDRLAEVDNQIVNTLFPPRSVSPFPTNRISEDDEIPDDYLLFAQTMFNQISGIYSNFMPVEVTGKMDEVTRENIRTMQRVSGREETGILDKFTWNKLTHLYEDVL